SAFSSGARRRAWATRSVRRARSTCSAASPAMPRFSRRCGPVRRSVWNRRNTQRKGSGRMKIFLDTANVAEIKEGVALGVVDGVTTNPSLIAKEKRPFRPLVEEICKIVPGDVSLEVVATDFEGMVKEGEELAQIAPNVVVKVPLTYDGLKAVKYFSGKGIRVNQTLCFSAPQALLSAKAGATYISPFLGRLDDIAAVGMDLIRDICEIYRNYGFKTQVL